MAWWLLKTEPSTYAFDDLRRDRKTLWDGVTNPQAQANLRAMKPGDTVVVYHSGEKAAVGLARVVGAPRADPGDPDGKRVAVQVAAGRPFATPVPLATLRESGVFDGSPLLRQGRLSVVGLTERQGKAIVNRGRR